MQTIRELAKQHQLSRSTLLYYDEIGLLRPSTRSASNYRLYDKAASERLDLIRGYRETGLPLEKIRTLLDEPKGNVSEALNLRLTEINELRHQQAQIVSMLKNSKAFQKTRLMDKERWVELLRQSGLNDDDMIRWHQTFERQSPEAHQDFLESLGIPEDEINSIRQSSKPHKVS